MLHACTVAPTPHLFTQASKGQAHTSKTHSSTCGRHSTKPVRDTAWGDSWGHLALLSSVVGTLRESPRKKAGRSPNTVYIVLPPSQLLKASSPLHHRSSGEVDTDRQSRRSMWQWYKILKCDEYKKRLAYSFPFLLASPEAWGFSLQRTAGDTNPDGSAWQLWIFPYSL